MIFFLIESAGAQKSGEQLLREGYKRYGVKQGVVEYKLTGMMSGEETLYFDLWGLRERREKTTEITAGSRTIRTTTVGIIDGEITYTLDPDKKSGTKLTNTLLTEITKHSGEKDLTELGEAMMKRMGGKKKGSGKIAGVDCEIWEVKSLQAKSWVWRGVTLKNEVTMMGGIHSEAVRADFESSPGAERFVIPSGYTITDAGAVRDILKKTKKKK